MALFEMAQALTKRAGTIYQTSTISALLEGVYDGDVTVEQMLAHGDFGLGTFNHLDGEMIILDGTCYHLRADGSARVADAGDRTPFAAVTWFRADRSKTVVDSRDAQSVKAAIDHLADSPNVTLAVRITGSFRSVRTRTLSEQHRPYPRLIDATNSQQEEAFTNVSGVIAGYRTAPFEQGIAVAGYHLHFLDDQRQHGGHVLDFHLDAGVIDVAIETDLHLSLPQTAEFLHATTDPETVDQEIHSVEGG